MACFGVLLRSSGLMLMVLVLVFASLHLCHRL